MVKKIRTLSPVWIAVYSVTFIFAVFQAVSIVVLAPYKALRAFAVLVPVITFITASLIRSYFNGEKELNMLIIGFAVIDAVLWTTSSFIHID